jgi:Recombinase
MRADGVNTASSIAPSSLAGATSMSSTTTSAAPVAALRVPASSSCSQRSATVVSARQRSQEALKQKARRGALVLGVAAGYVKIGRDRIEKNPDKRVQDALQLVFTKFAELQSARQVHIWLREEGIELPVKSRQGEAHGVVWRLPAYNIVHNILTNPIYAGAYAFGRTKSRVSLEGGRKHIRRGVQKPMAEWDVSATRSCAS